MSFNFGTPKPTFGVQPTQAVGATPAAGTNFSFGGAPSATPTTAPPAFGALGSTSLGAPAASSSFSFGGAAAPAATTASFGFGAPAATTASFGFGAPAAAPTSTSFGFGAPAAATTSTSFGFGAPAATASAPTLSLSFGGTSTTATAPASTGLSFGLTTSTAAPASTGFGSFGVPGATNPLAASAGFSLGGQQQPQFGVASTQAVTAPISASIGLGGSNLGIGTTSTSQTTTTDPKSTAAQNSKETAIPNVLLETVEEFKKFVKEERSISSDIAHASPKIHTKISEEIAAMHNLVSTLMTGLSRNCALLDKIKIEAAQEILNAEIAQRTKDTPRGLQYENMAPYEYFTRLIGKFETQMVHYRRQIEETEQHLISMANGQAMTPEDVAQALQKLHSAFVALAGGYQSIHEKIFALSEQFVQWHRYRYFTDK